MLLERTNMKKRIIEISVNDEYVLGSGVVIGAAGADKSVILRVAFNDAWVGLNIYATFRNSMGESPTIMMLMPSMLSLGETMVYEITVPAAATAHAGKMSLVFSGFAVTSVNVFDTETQEYDKLVYRDAVINTTNAYFRVLPSDFSALDVEDQAEVTALEQVLSEINELHGDIVEHEESVGNQITEFDKRIKDAEGVVAQLREEADSGVFKGDKGDKGDKGEKGDAGVIEFIIVTELPTEDIKNAIYLVPSADTESGNAFDEYIYVNGVWEKIGNASVAIDLNEFAKKEYVDDKVGEISAALDELHAYAEALKGGEAL